VLDVDVHPRGWGKPLADKSGQGAGAWKNKYLWTSFMDNPLQYKRVAIVSNYFKWTWPPCPLTMAL